MTLLEADRNGFISLNHRREYTAVTERRGTVTVW